MHTVDGLPYFRRSAKAERYVNPLNYEYALFVFDFAANIGREPTLIRIDFARCQRAPEGSNHSPRSCGNNVIDCRRVGLADFVYIDTVVLGDRAMHTECHRFFFARQVRKA